MRQSFRCTNLTRSGWTKILPDHDRRFIYRILSPLVCNLSNWIGKKCRSFRRVKFQLFHSCSDRYSLCHNNAPLSSIFQTLNPWKDTLCNRVRIVQMRILLLLLHAIHNMISLYNRYYKRGLIIILLDHRWDFNMDVEYASRILAVAIGEKTVELLALCRNWRAQPRRRIYQKLNGVHPIPWFISRLLSGLFGPIEIWRSIQERSKARRIWMGEAMSALKEWNFQLSPGFKEWCTERSPYVCWWSRCSRQFKEGIVRVWTLSSSGCTRVGTRCQSGRMQAAEISNQSNRAMWSAVTIQSKLMKRDPKHVWPRCVSIIDLLIDPPIVEVEFVQQGCTQE